MNCLLLVFFMFFKFNLLFSNLPVNQMIQPSPARRVFSVNIITVMLCVQVLPLEGTRHRIIYVFPSMREDVL